MKIDDAIKLLDGAAGTSVNIQIFRNAKYYNYSLVRISTDTISEEAAANLLDDYAETSSKDSSAESIGIKIDSFNGWLWVRQVFP